MIVNMFINSGSSGWDHIILHLAKLKKWIDSFIVCFPFCSCFNIFLCVKFLKDRNVICIINNNCSSDVGETTTEKINVFIFTGRMAINEDSIL